jgi:hypothetical protein
LAGVLALELGVQSSPVLADESVAEIMRRVAENQETAREARQRFLYRQELQLRFLQLNGQVCREDFRHYDVFPQSQKTEKKLIFFLGRYFKDGKFYDYHKPGYKYKEIDLDGELISDLAGDFANDQKSRDGLSQDLFPLTAEQQKEYRFILKSRENFRGREVYRIAFEPDRSSKSINGENAGGPWAGEAVIDAVEYQPVQVTTRLALHIPFWVKTIFGTNLKHLGFKVDYAKFEDGVWFPVSYGGEFQLKVVFFYGRTMVVTLRNSDFRQTSVSTNLAYDAPLDN